MNDYILLKSNNHLVESSLIYLNDEEHETKALIHFRTTNNIIKEYMKKLKYR